MYKAAPYKAHRQKGKENTIQSSPTLCPQTPHAPDTAVFTKQRLQCLGLLSFLPCSTESIMPPSPRSALPAVVLMQTIYRQGEQSFNLIQTPALGYYISLLSSVCSDLKICKLGGHMVI